MTRYISIDKKTLVGGVGFVIGLALVAAVSVAQADYNNPNSTMMSVRDPANDQWFCDKAGKPTCWFAKGNPCPDAGGSHPSTQSQQAICGWVADSCGCEAAFTDEVPTTVPTMVPTTVPTTQPPPSPPDDGGGNDDGDTPPASVVVTGQPVRIPVNCEDPYDSLEEVLAGLTWEIDRKIVQWASVVGILEFPFCPEGPVYPDEAALDILGLPKFRELKPLPAALGTLLDVVDPELARMLELFLNLGFRSEKPAFLLCNAYLPMRHFCPKGARTANPLDVEEGYTWAWWSKVGPGSQPPKASEEFLKQYPEMVNYPDSAPYISAFFSAAEHHDREGPQRVCPRTTPNRNCDITMMQWFEALWRLHGQD